MATATVHIFADTGALTSGHGTTRTDVDASTIKFGLTDAVDASGSPISVPTATGTNFSYGKWLYLDVTVAATTSSNLLNRTIKFDSSPTGLKYHFKAVASGAYVQSAAAADSASVSNGATPTGFTTITSSAQSYDSASVASTGTGENGGYAEVCAGVDNLYVAGGGLSANTIFSLGYDEQRSIDCFAHELLDSSYGERLQARRLRHLPVSWRRGGSLY